MPFQIIRNDITKVKADAIVNTANPRPVVGGGTDRAIYEAAGEKELLAARKQIGDIARGDVAVTPAFGLKAKYIIHTVGPVWEGGDKGEFDILHSCYRKSLQLAGEKGCESIAFPLIATGVYGFPKDKAITIATAEISEFLMDHDMTVLLVVFDKKAFELSGKLFADVRSFVDEHYVKRSYKKEYHTDITDRSAHLMDPEEYELEYIRRRRNEPEETDEIKEEKPQAVWDEEPAQNYIRLFLSEAEGKSLAELLNEKHMTFTDRLLELIDRSGMTDLEVYKAANVTKKVFSDVRNKPGYKPSKRTAVGFAIALRLNMYETIDLLGRAGLAFSETDKFDLVVGYFIKKGNYDMYDINLALEDAGQESIGAIR